MTRTPMPHLALLLSLIAGCSDAKIGAEDAALDTGYSDGDGTAADLVPLRLDIYPSDAGPELRPQSWQVEVADGWQGIDVELEAPINLVGTVTGYAATPPSAITVPGEQVPVIANVALFQQGSIAGAATSSTADGAFRLQITPGSDYRLSVIPLDPIALPFAVVSDLSLSRSGALDVDALDLGYGLPVYGLVTSSAGVPVSRTEVSLTDPETGISGPSTETDADGYYQLRSEPGAWTLNVVGQASKAIPSVTREIEVDPVSGVREDIDLGEIASVSFGCQIVDEEGEPVSDVTVRLTATALEDDEWSLVRETNPDQNGDVLVKLLPGTYTAEFIPSYDTGLSPQSMELTVGSSGLELQSGVVLTALEMLSGRVFGPSDQPLANVAISAVELGFDHQVYSGSSDGNGSFSLLVPSVPMELTFTPSSSDVAIHHTDYDPDTDTLRRVTLSEGRLVTGTLLVDGEPAPYAVVEIHNAEDDTLLGKTLSGEDGSFAARVEP